jgi:hypothetical protein
VRTKEKGREGRWRDEGGKEWWGVLNLRLPWLLQFSLMQYSNILKTHFTFTEFKSSLSPQSLVDAIVQLQGLTYTASGIQKVV